MRWCFAKGWAGQLHTAEEPNAVAAVVAGAMSGTEFLFRFCDGTFTDHDLSEEGNLFAAQYYGDDGLYLDEYTEQFGDLMYVAGERLHDFHRFTALLDSRLASGILTRSQTAS